MSLSVTESDVIEPDKSMLPYYCDENGVYLSRQTIFSPSIKPYILIRANIGNTSGAIIASPEGTTKVVDGRGRPLDASVDQERLRKYLENIEIHFLNEIRITCTVCSKIVGPPGVGRSGKHTYCNITCANCSRLN
jgi:hypothetical protein